MVNTKVIVYGHRHMNMDMGTDMGASGNTYGCRYRYSYGILKICMGRTAWCKQSANCLCIPVEMLNINEPRKM